MRPAEEFPYSTVAVSNRVRALVTTLLFVGAGLFLLLGEGASLFDAQLGARLSGEQNLTVNLFIALVCLVVGFLNLFWIFKKKPSGATSVLISEDRIVAPKQGVSGKTVEIHFSDITHLKKLSVDGAWELNVNTPDKHIRVPKTSLNVPEDFERMVFRVQQLAQGCELQIEQRIDPPQVTT